MYRNLFFAALALLSSCTSKQHNIPDGIIPSDTMVVIMADMHIADAIAETKAQGGENEKNLSTKYQDRILAQHKITAEQFKQSFDFYENTPDLMNAIYDQVLVEVSKREAALSKGE